MLTQRNTNCYVRRFGMALLMTTAVGLMGCATNKSLYQWQSYQNNVYEYLREDRSSLEEQIESMEQGLQKIQAQGGVIPPGYNAHLGLLYAKTGNLDEFANRLTLEKTQYPESQPYVDFLLRNFKTKN